MAESECNTFTIEQEAPRLSVAKAHAKWLRCRAAFDDPDHLRDDSESPDLIAAEAGALVDLAFSPARSFDELVLKLGALDLALRDFDVDRGTRLLAASLTTDLRHVVRW